MLPETAPPLSPPLKNPSHLSPLPHEQQQGGGAAGRRPLSAMASPPPAMDPAATFSLMVGLSWCSALHRSSGGGVDASAVAAQNDNVSFLLSIPYSYSFRPHSNRCSPPHRASSTCPLSIHHCVVVAIAAFQDPPPSAVGRPPHRARTALAARQRLLHLQGFL